MPPSSVHSVWCSAVQQTSVDLENLCSLALHVGEQTQMEILCTSEPAL